MEQHRRMVGIWRSISVPTSKRLERTMVSCAFGKSCNWQGMQPSLRNARITLSCGESLRAT
eukprot:2243027-Pleurochrysis_carterae.AAC.1